MLNIVLFGPPGAGKGTQAEVLVEKFKLKHLSTGDILRDRIAKKTELGILAKSYIDQGNLVPDEVVVGMIKNVVKENQDAKGFIFDGFPRTTEQAVALDEMLKELEIPLTGMLALEVEKEELIKRLLERGKTSGRSDDADVSVIENRINVYNEKTFPLVSYYSKQDKYHPIEGIGTIEEITTRLEKVINSFK